MSEFQCESTMVCNNDQSSFKAYLARWMAVTASIVPFTYDLIMPKLRDSAVGAAAQCTGGGDGRACGRQWYAGFDGSLGVGQQVSSAPLGDRLKNEVCADMRQMQALAVIGATTMNPGIAPKTANTGGTSISDPDAGTNADAAPIPKSAPVTTADKAGAAILTLLAAGVVIGGCVWITM